MPGPGWHHLGRTPRVGLSDPHGSLPPGAGPWRFRSLLAPSGSSEARARPGSPEDGEGKSTSLKDGNNSLSATLCSSGAARECQGLVARVAHPPQTGTGRWEGDGNSHFSCAAQPGAGTLRRGWDGDRSMSGTRVARWQHRGGSGRV